MPNLKSSTEQLGRLVTQIIHFSHGNKRTFENIDTSTIKQGEFTKMKLKDGRLLLVNTNNVDCVEVFSQDDFPNNSIWEHLKAEQSQLPEAWISQIGSMYL